MAESVIGFEMYSEILDQVTGNMEKVGGGDPVIIEPNHTFVVGTTGSGKSKALQRLVSESIGKRMLIIDVKRKRDFGGLKADIPLYIKQQMEPIVIKDSIETTERFTIKQQFGTLLDTVAEAETWDQMLEVIERELKNKKKNEYTKNNLKILKYFLKRLVKEHHRFDWSKKLKLNKGISVLNISQMGIQMQQLIVGSAINYIENNYTDVTVVIDEAHRFIPQGETSGCSRDVVRFIREGRASNNFVWLADQTMTGIEKNVLKQMQYWVLGRQPELNEAKRTVQQIPRAKSRGVNIEAIQTLGLGEFLVVCHEWVKRTYIWPLWISKEIAIRVAQGAMTAKQVAKQEKKKVEDDDEMWKSQFEQEQRARKAAEAESEKLKTTIAKMSDVKVVADTTVSDKKISDLDAELKNITEAYQKEQLQWVKATEEQAEKIKLLQGKLELENQDSQDLTKIRSLLSSGSIEYTAQVHDVVYDKLKEDITREIMANVGTGVIKVTEDIELGKYYQTQAYTAIIEMFSLLDDDTIKILGYIVEIGKGVSLKEIILAVYHKTSKGQLGRGAPIFNKRMEKLKTNGFTEERGGRIHSNIEDFIKVRMSSVGATKEECDDVLRKIKGYIADKLKGVENGG